MAFDRNAIYGTRWSAPSTAHPEGAFINRTSPTADDGSYLEEKWINSFSALPEALIHSAGITLNGVPDEVGNSQYMEGLVEQVSGRSINYDCSGPANAYVLSVRTSQYGPQSYFDGMSVEFKPNVTNTGASTVNVNSLGVINISNTSSGGELTSGDAVRLRYNSTTGQFQIISKVNAGNVTTSQFNGGTIDQTFEQINFRSSAQPTGPQCNLTYDNASGHTLRLTHNGTTGTPKYQFFNADGTDARMLEVEGVRPNANLYAYGEIRNIRNGGSNLEIVPNHDDFYFENNIASAQYIQQMPNKNLTSSTLGGTLFVSFLTDTLSNGIVTNVSFPVTFSDVPPSVVITPFSNSIASTTTGGWGVVSISTTNVVIGNYLGIPAKFCVMVIGEK